MATSGTTAFNMSFDEIAEEAFDRAGRPLRTGYDLKTARRSLNLLTIEWQNKGINLWTVEQGSMTLNKGQGTGYVLPADTIDLLEHQIRTDVGNSSTQSDISIQRLGIGQYATITNKLSQGRPVNILIERLRDAPQVTVWPVPDREGYVLNYWRTRRIQDIGNASNEADVVFRFLPCLIAGLAYQIALKIPEAIDRLPVLKVEYDLAFLEATSEDRERVSFTVSPDLSGY